MGNIYIGLLTGGILILAGLLCWKHPELLSPTGIMSENEKENVDLKSAGKASCIILVTTGIVSFALNWILCATGHVEAGISVMTLSIPAGVIILLFLMKKYDRNPTGWKYSLAIGFIAVFFVVTGAMMLIWTKPEAINIDNGSVCITGDYATEVRLNDIRMIELLDSLPEITARTNGIGQGNINKGHFRLEGVGACRLYVNLKYSPFIHIVTAEGEHIFFNTDDPARTMDLYKSISASAGTLTPIPQPAS